jgi:protein-S-isoprenylcysteine O-methyltransferase Ste14
MQNFQEPVAIFIMTLWLGIWTVLFFGGSRKNTLATHPALLRYSILTFVLIFIFYTLLFTPSLSMDASPTNLQLLASGAIMLAGAYLTVRARLAMKNITAREILFSINPAYTSSGVYKQMSHPMYFGILMILAGSLSVYPSLHAFIVLLGICYCLHKKANLE